MNPDRLFHLIIGTLLSPPGRRDEPGLSQATQNVSLLVGAVTIAVLVIAAVTSYVNSHLTLVP